MTRQELFDYCLQQYGTVPAGIIGALVKITYDTAPELIYSK
jgi:hypothetical protein